MPTLFISYQGWAIAGIVAGALLIVYLIAVNNSPITTA
jgi:hypothetical protein